MNCVGRSTKGICGHLATKHEVSNTGFGVPGPCEMNGCDCDGYLAPPQPGDVLMTRDNLPSPEFPAIQQNSNTFAVSIPEGIIETKTIVTFYPKEKK